jgi:maleylacetate reductase
MQGTHHWPAQQRVIYGTKAAEAIAAEVADTKATRVFVTTTRSLTAGKLVAEIVAALGLKFAGKFDDISAHSPREAVVNGAAGMRGAAADLVVAVGGGSVIDATKVMLLALWRDVTSVAQLDAYANRPPSPASAWYEDPQALRMLSVSTTLSAAEFTHFAGVTDAARRVKQMYGHPLMAPRVAILDPAATIETPIDLLLSTGMRAVDHAVERWCSLRVAPFADAVSRQAMHMLAQALPAIKDNPSDMNARLEAQQGMWLAQLGFTSGVPYGASHGIGYLLGGGLGVPHGVTSCIMLPAVLTWNEAVNRERQQTVREIFGPQAPSAGAAMRAFVRRLGQPDSLQTQGISRSQLRDIAALYDGTGPIASNPRKVNGVDDLVEILELAY